MVTTNQDTTAADLHRATAHASCIRTARPCPAPAATHSQAEAALLALECRRPDGFGTGGVALFTGLDGSSARSRGRGGHVSARHPRTCRQWQVAAVNSVEIRSVATGTLAVLAVAEGELVEEAATLAHVDPAAQNAIVRQAMAGLDASLVAQQQAAETYDRAVSLGANISRTVLEANAHAVQTATQDVARQTAALDQARVVLDNHTLRAPITGTVTVLEAELQQLVGPTIALLALADLNDLVLEADVDEAYPTQITAGLPVVLQLAGETRTHDGHISFVSSRIDIATGGLAVETPFDAPVVAPIGLTVALNIIIEQRDTALTVPRSALLADGTGVFIVNDGTAQRRVLSVVERPAARLIVTDGLSEGDVVILDAAGIEDGQAITLEQP